MKKRSTAYILLVLAGLFFFVFSTFVESSAWARAGGGKSSGSRGSRSFSTPSAPPSRSPSSPSPGSGSPGLGLPGRSSPQPSVSPSTGGFFSRNPFWSGVAGGLAGGLIGNMLFGGHGHAGYGGYGATGSRGGIPFLDLLVLGLLVYFGWKFFKRWRASRESVGAGYPDVGPTAYADQDYASRQGAPPQNEVDRGLAQIGRYDSGFSEEAFKEMVQDMFFRIQAGWMNRSLEGIENLLTGEMADFFRSEFASMIQQGLINRLENIAVRKVEPSEVWQESGRDFVTVLFTANLLDYTVNERTGQVVSGDRLNPVKFQEFWTFCRDIGSSQWKLSGINQANEPSPRYN